MPKIYFPSQAEFEDIIELKFERILSDKLPALIRKATQKQYFTISDACELLSCSRRHLLYLRQSGQINFVKNGKKIFFKREDLEAFFDDNYTETVKDTSLDSLTPGEVKEINEIPGMENFVEWKKNNQ